MVSRTGDNPSSELPWPRWWLAGFLSKIEPTVYIRNANSSLGARQLGWASCLTSAGRDKRDNFFFHINALARLTRTTLSAASVTYCLDFGLKAEICIKEAKVSSEKHAVIKWSRETQRKRNIELPLREGCLGYPRPYNWAIRPTCISTLFYQLYKVLKVSLRRTLLLCFERKSVMRRVDEKRWKSELNNGCRSNSLV